MHSAHDAYCERSAALGEGFPDLVGGVLGLGFGLVRGSMLAARRLAENAIWMSPGCAPNCCCGCSHVHRVSISDCGPCVSRSGCCCCCG
jgi:hypothetical protein